MALKLFVLLSLAALAVAKVPSVLDNDDVLLREIRAAAKLSANDQSITIGGITPYDRQLTQAVVSKKGSWLSVNKLEYNFPSGGATGTIASIQIVDLQKDGKNAEATVQRGGVGHNNVNIRFKSQRGGNINYLVIVWGH